MSHKTQKKQKIFIENPYDIETFFESISLASLNDKELQFMDRFISCFRKNPECDLTQLNYDILKSLDLID